jgi:3-keto-5-aminohexanoate cleavage enzyme
MFRYPEKIIVTVAPVAHQGTFLPQGVRNPLSPEDVARETADCAQAGAAMVHLHVRNPRGEQVRDLRWFSETIGRIREKSDIIIQGSTGGVSDLSLAERCVSVTEPRTETASLNLGSVNFGEGVYINTLPDIRFWIGEMKKHRVAAELELFDFGMFSTVETLVKEGLLVPPLNYNFCLGFKGALPADPRFLKDLVSLLPGGARWGLNHEGMGDFRLLAAALALGAGSIRVGYEDGCSYLPGKPASSNAVLVQKVVELVRSLGFEPASPAEARKILGLGPVSKSQGTAD